MLFRSLVGDNPATRAEERLNPRLLDVRILLLELLGELEGHDGESGHVGVCDARSKLACEMVRIQEQLTDVGRQANGLSSLGRDCSRLQKTVRV